ncbi:hypothetical protein BSZ35_05655 [Salinibacter sp. 10B]|nr:hypothetical protein BSZ35_05655 [Salinibacter sp. 10B]
MFLVFKIYTISVDLQSLEAGKCEPTCPMAGVAIFSGEYFLWTVGCLGPNPSLLCTRLRLANEERLVDSFLPIKRAIPVFGLPVAYIYSIPTDRSPRLPLGRVMGTVVPGGVLIAVPELSSFRYVFWEIQ